MRSAYRTLAYLIAAGVAVQAASVALGVFTILDEVEDGGAFTGYDPATNLGMLTHAFGGMVIVVVALALLVVSLFTRVPGAARWALGVFGLVVLQVTLAYVAFGLVPVGALHGLNALAVFATAIWAGRRITRVAHADEQALDAAAV